MSLQSNLEQVVAFDTTSSLDKEVRQSNEKLIDYLKEHFDECGFVVGKFEITPENYNMVALSPVLFTGKKALALAKAVKNDTFDSKPNTKAGAGKLGVLLSAHTDCVPFVAAKWHSDPLKVTEKQGKLYGRGTSDMKGFIACMMELATYIKDKCEGDPERYPPVSFLFTADEECTMCGAQAFTQVCTDGEVEMQFETEYMFDYGAWLGGALGSYLKANKIGVELFDDWATARLQCGESFALTIIGEPTMMQPVVAHKGWFARELHCHGKTGHSSQPAQGLNAISLSKTAISGLESLQERFATEAQDEHFAVPHPTLSMGTIAGGQGYNSICDQVTIGFDLRPTPDLSMERLNELLEQMRQQIIAQLKEQYGSKLEQIGDGNVDECVTLSTPFPDTPAFVNNDEYSLSLVKDLLPQSTWQYVNYCTEASFLQVLNPCVVLGPGDIAQAHTVDEFIEMAQLEQCFAFLKQLADKLEPAVEQTEQTTPTKPTKKAAKNKKGKKAK